MSIVINYQVWFLCMCSLTLINKSTQNLATEKKGKENTVFFPKFTALQAFSQGYIHVKA